MATTREDVTLVSLAAKVKDLSEELAGFLKNNNVPVPTLEADSPVSYSGLTAESFLLRQRLLDTVQDLSYLVQGPSESVFNYCHTTIPDVACLNTLNHFDFWAAVPLDGAATYTEIAQRVSLPEEVVQRLLEHATTLRLFTPTSLPNQVRHTSRSAALARTPGLRALVTTIIDDAGPPSLILNHALDKYNRNQPQLSNDMSQTAFALHHKGQMTSPWAFIEDDGEGARKGWRARNFAVFMNYVKEIFMLEDVLAKAFDWAAAGEIKVVDLGGSGGHDAIALAQKFPNLSITVQDLPEARPVFDATLPASLASRVSFQAHDFFQPQPSAGVDVFLIKLILHDWPTAECVAILRGLVPAMKTGGKVVFVDYVGKQQGQQKEGKQGGSEGAGAANGEAVGEADGEGEAGGKTAEQLPRSIQAMGTATDLRMLALFATKERAVEEWKDIFGRADERFVVERVEANPLTFMVVMEVGWRG